MSTVKDREELRNNIAFREIMDAVVEEYNNSTHEDVPEKEAWQQFVHILVSYSRDEEDNPPLEDLEND